MYRRYAYINISVIQIVVLLLLILLIFQRQGAGILNSQKDANKDDIKIIYNNDTIRYSYPYPKEVVLLNTNFFSQERDTGKQQIGSLTHMFVSQLETYIAFTNQSFSIVYKHWSLVKYWFGQLVILLTEYKLSFLKRLVIFMGEDTGNLVFGMLFGDISQMKDNLKNTLRITGMLHVVSASGFNISILVTLFSVIFENKVSKQIWLILISSIIFLYLILADFSPSIIRAAVMFAFGLVIKSFHRQGRALFALIWSVIFLLILMPDFLTSLSFQLSVLATFGIILLVPKLTKSKQSVVSSAFLGESMLDSNLSDKSSFLSSIKSGFKDGLVTTLSASLFVSPLLIVSFKELSLVSFMANPALLWLTPVITVLSLVIFFVYIVFSLLNYSGNIVFQIMALIISWPIYIFTQGLEFFGQFSWGVINFK